VSLLNARKTSFVYFSQSSFSKKVNKILLLYYLSKLQANEKLSQTGFKSEVQFSAQKQHCNILKADDFFIFWRECHFFVFKDKK
jgi:hypothetical protein